MVPETNRFYVWFGRAMINYFTRQQALLSTQFGMATKRLGAGEMATGPGSVASPPTISAGSPRLPPTRGPGEGGRSDKTGPQGVPDRISALVAEAQARMRDGFPPPRAIYQVQNRGKIDWALFPDWARPVSPELYDGCSHEG